MSERKWHLEHKDGSDWIVGELNKAIRDAREHDRLWPIDARFLDVAIGLDGDVYVLDNCQAWHQLDDDVVVVWDD